MTTKHNHPPRFGQKFANCPRCDELKAGAAPIVWQSSRAQQEAQKRREIDVHFNSHFHRSGACGPVCTFGEW